MIVLEKFGGFRKYIRENWREYFYVRVSSALIYKKKEGEKVLPFFLPVYREYRNDSWVCVPVVIAPFVLMLIAIYHGLKSMWGDLVYTIDCWRYWNR
jgi:hypothetical protein